MKARSYYFLLLGAVVLDAAVLPWFVSAGWMFKAVWAVLPFIFLFAPGKHWLFLGLLALIYFRAASYYNLGVLFLGLCVFLIYERWFLKNFFNKTAWQSLFLASAGLVVFYIIISGLNWLTASKEFYFTESLLLPLLFSVMVSAGLNFLLCKIYRLE